MNRIESGSETSLHLNRQRFTILRASDEFIYFSSFDILYRCVDDDWSACPLLICLLPFVLDSVGDDCLPSPAARANGENRKMENWEFHSFGGVMNRKKWLPFALSFVPIAAAFKLLSLPGNNFRKIKQ